MDGKALGSILGEHADYQEYKILGSRRKRVLEMPMWLGVECGQNLDIPSGRSLPGPGKSRVSQAYKGTSSETLEDSENLQGPKRLRDLGNKPYEIRTP